MSKPQSLWTFRRLWCVVIGHKPRGALYNSTLAGLHAQRCERCGTGVLVNPKTTATSIQSLLCTLEACSGLNEDGTCPMGYGVTCEGVVVPAPGPAATVARLAERVRTDNWEGPTYA